MGVIKGDTRSLNHSSDGVVPVSPIPDYAALAGALQKSQIDLGLSVFGLKS